jgi:hypothetical protein
VSYLVKGHGKVNRLVGEKGLARFDRGGLLWQTGAVENAYETRVTCSMKNFWTNSRNI